jgi:acyl carrier protein
MGRPEPTPQGVELRRNSVGLRHTGENLRKSPGLDTFGQEPVYLRENAGKMRGLGRLRQARGRCDDFRRILTVASVQDRVIDIVASQLGVAKDQITAETSFINDLGADSLDTVELVMELEEEFEINIPDDAAEKIQTVGQAVEFIEKHQA